MPMSVLIRAGPGLSRRAVILTTNQDNSIYDGLVPLLSPDVW
jgi:hypothetical protein